MYIQPKGRGEFSPATLPDGYHGSAFSPVPPAEAESPAKEEPREERKETPFPLEDFSPHPAEEPAGEERRKREEFAETEETEEGEETEEPAEMQGGKEEKEREKNACRRGGFSRLLEDLPFLQKLLPPPRGKGEGFPEWALPALLILLTEQNGKELFPFLLLLLLWN